MNDRNIIIFTLPQYTHAARTWCNTFLPDPYVIPIVTSYEMARGVALQRSRIIVYENADQHLLNHALTYNQSIWKVSDEISRAHATRKNSASLPS